MIMEALAEMKSCSECGAMYEMGAEHECGMYEGEEDDVDESMGGAALAGGGGYTIPLGMRPSGPRRDSVTRTAHRSFGGLPKPRKKR